MLRHALLCALALSMSAFADDTCQLSMGSYPENQVPVRTSPADPWLGVKGDLPADGLPSKEQVAAFLKKEVNELGPNDININARRDEVVCDAAHDHCLRDCTWFTMYRHYGDDTQSLKDPQSIVVPGHFRDRVFYPPSHLTARWNAEDDYDSFRTVPATKRLLKPGVRVILPSQMMWDNPPNELTMEREIFSPWVMATVASADWEKNSLRLQGIATPVTLTYARVVVLTYKKGEKVMLAPGFTREQISLKPTELKPAEATGGALLAREVTRVAPEKGAPVITKLRPTWCGNPAIDVRGKSAQWLGIMLKGQYPLSQVEKAVLAMCVAPDDAVFQEQVGAYYQAWANETGQSPEQLTEFFALNADQEAWNRQHEETCAKVAVPEEASPRELSLGGMRKAILGCGYGSQTGTPRHLEATSTSITDEDLFHFDRGAEVPSQLAAIFRVLTCVGLDEPDAPYTLARFAGCAADLAQLDEKKLVEELKRGGFNDYARVTALQALAVTKRRAAAVEAKLTALAKKDPDVQAALIEAPRRAWKDWQAQASANQAALDAAWAAEDAPPAKGCLSAAQAAVDGFIKKADTTEELLTQATSPVGAVLLERLRACNVAEGRPEAAAMLETAIRWGFPRRGPRFYAGLAMTEAVVKAKEKRASFPIPPDATRFPNGGPVTLGQRNVDLGAQYSGTVAKVTTKGGRVFVTFKTEKHLDDERECHETSRIVMFRPDGSPLYETICKLTGRKVESSSTTTPFWVWAPQAAGIAAGTFVRFNGGTTMVDGVSSGAPVEVKAAGGKKLLAAMGLEAR